MKKYSADNIERKSDTSHDNNQAWVFDKLKRNETFDRLQKNADTQRQQEDTVEESAQELGSLPSEGEILR